MNTTGYSGTPLAKKLGIKQGFTLKLVNAPEYYFHLFTDFPADTIVVNDEKTPVNFIHFFVTDVATLKKSVSKLKKQMKPDAAMWVSWYKKAAKIPTDVTEDIIRTIAIENGLVDIKVCAVDDKWSGLKLVIPVKDRQ